MTDLTEIQRRLTENKSILFKRYPIKNLAIFGEFARNERKQKVIEMFWLNLMGK